MKLIVCLDDKNGMSFNSRRQSADSVVIAKILDYVGSNPLYMNTYSGKLFADKGENVIADDHFLQLAGENDYCFAEITDVSDYIFKADEIVVFRWNRVYPAQLYFPANVLDSGFTKKIVAEFSGSSHDKISQEVYTR